jgi:5-methylcytosine-specific restriction protein A
MTHISVEHLVLSERFRRLFAQEELAEAQRRLAALPSHVERRRVPAAENYPETLPTRREYFEGAVQQVLVNAYERDPKAREACLKWHGYHCAVCDMTFEERYGEIGRDFIHVHHTKPLATCRREYCIDLERDLVPVCPNCHAMLHTSDPPKSVEELRSILQKPLPG